MATEKAKKLKGQRKESPDTERPDENPLLKVDNRVDFEIETSNLLQDPGKLLFPGFENFDIKKEKDQFDVSKLNDNTQIIIVLRYYEYLSIATFRFSFMIPLLQSGLTARDSFEMIKHSLRNKLLLNAPTFDTIFEPEFQYIGKIRY